MGALNAQQLHAGGRLAWVKSDDEQPPQPQVISRRLMRWMKGVWSSDWSIWMGT